MIAKDIMTKDVITVGPLTTVKNLAKILAQAQVSGAPVIDKKRKVLGIASEADIIGKRGRQVKAIMTKKVISVSEDTPIEEIAFLIDAHRIKRVPVKLEEKLVGIVSRADIVRAFAMGKHFALHTPIYDL
jgi:CBS domain-containing protein